MDNLTRECVLNGELYQIDNEIHFLENNNLEYHKKIEENSKKIEELKKKLEEKEALIKKLLEEKEAETKRRFEEAQAQAEEYSVTVQPIKFVSTDRISNSDWYSIAASARLKAETKLIQGLIFEVDSEGQTDKLPPKKSKWEF
jgi:predicted RNase H-like nuclease (RuvC/YqgF family)